MLPAQREADFSTGEADHMFLHSLSTLRRVVLHRVVLHRIVLHWIAFHWIAFHWIALAGLAAGLPALAAGPCAAEPLFSFAATPGRLPKTVVPLHYALDLAPDLDKLTFSGSEVIDIDVEEPTAHLTLNAVDLAIESAAVDGDAADVIPPDADAQTVRFDFPHPIAAGQHRLRVVFAGRINPFARGLFYVDYPVADGRRRMISTQLEPADARRIFPAFDEPAFKASFALTVTVPQAFLAVSNMPVASEEPAGEGRKRVAFQPTPRMSSYLFVLTAGDMERITADVDGVTVGIVATHGKAEHGRYALEAARDLLRYYNGYFGTAYPLPKLDLIAVPGGFGGAMENWGGITFFESGLLFDPAASADGNRRNIFAIIAHEMAHQWFGDLVTMAWWDNLWLNEGFASWMEAKAADTLHPEWQTWLNNGVEKRSTMDQDARRTSHPIQQPIANESEAMAAFDDITYTKGQAVIRMLENYVGEDAFRAGIRAYVARHGYSNTTTADLWSALQAASGKPVTAIAAGFTEQGGVPLVVAQASCTDGAQRVVLRQERFTIHDPAPQDSPTKAQRWKVPVVRGGIDGKASDIVLLDDKAEFTAGRCGDPVKLNFGDVGYYRVQYDSALQFLLMLAIDRLPPADRAGFLGDTWALVEAGRVAPAAFFELADRMRGDDNRAVVNQIIGALSRINGLQWGRPERVAFHAYGRTVLRPLFDRIGWDAAPGETADTALLREKLIVVLGSYGDDAIVAEAKRRFAEFVRHPASLPTALRDPVTTLAGRTADRATYDTLLAMARRTTSADERERYYVAAASALAPELAKETLPLTLTDELPTTLVRRVMSAVAFSGEHRDLAWDFIKTNFGMLSAKLGPSFQDNFPAELLTAFADTAHAQELAGFAPAHATSGGRTNAAQSYEAIVMNADFTAQQLPAVDAWVKVRMARPSNVR
jgi:aminopeptidase N